jgi:broad specificity phosphatase PhoE
MLKIYIARHGQNEDNASGILNGHRDLPLTQKGIEQAREVAGEIAVADMYFDYIYASPLSRAFRTAQIISEVISGPKPEVEPLLIERDFGVMTGKETARITELCAPDIIQADPITYFLSPEGAETFPDLVARAHVLLDKIKNLHKDGSLLLVTHGDFGKMLYAAYYDLPWRDVLLQFHFGNSELILLSPDSPADDAHVFTIEQHNH